MKDAGETKTLYQNIRNKSQMTSFINTKLEKLEKIQKQTGIDLIQLLIKNLELLNSKKGQTENA